MIGYFLLRAYAAILFAGWWAASMERASLHQRMCSYSFLCVFLLAGFAVPQSLVDTAVRAAICTVSLTEGALGHLLNDDEERLCPTTR